MLVRLLDEFIKGLPGFDYNQIINLSFLKLLIIRNLKKTGYYCVVQTRKGEWW